MGFLSGWSWNEIENAVNTHFRDQGLAAQAQQMREMSRDTEHFDRRSRAKYAKVAERLEREGGR